MRRTEAERRRRAKNRAQRAKQRVLVLTPHLGYSTLERGHLILERTQVYSDAHEIRLHTRRRVNVLLEDEGRTWVRGWFGEVPDAFRAQVALLVGVSSTPEKFEMTGSAQLSKIIAYMT